TPLLSLSIPSSHFFCFFPRLLAAQLKDGIVFYFILPLHHLSIPPLDKKLNISGIFSNQTSLLF
ncbi:MAG: hypothetical protein NC176_07220, partial [Treponema brennaborense]|nr:hypothetical protein [Prevotella sp.]MCM1408257.1 hypothetical protein [Treponema brennaborense]